MDTIELQRIAEVEDGNWWYRERRALIGRELRRLGEPGRAVDIGAAAGGNTRVLLDHGWEATAVDLSGAAIRLAQGRGVEALQGDACYLPLPTADHDLALAMDVLAHIDDDHRAVTELVRVLRPGGTALLSVPCDPALWSAHDLAVGRVRRYSRQTFTELLTGAGLAIDWVRNWNVLLRPVARWCRHRVNGWEIKPRRPFADRMLGTVLALEDLLPVRSLRGTSLVARAHVPA